MMYLSDEVINSPESGIINNAVALMYGGMLLALISDCNYHRARGEACVVSLNRSTKLLTFCGQHLDG